MAPHAIRSANYLARDMTGRLKPSGSS